MFFLYRPPKILNTDTQARLQKTHCISSFFSLFYTVVRQQWGWWLQKSFWNIINYFYIRHMWVDCCVTWKMRTSLSLLVAWLISSSVLMDFGFLCDGLGLDICSSPKDVLSASLQSANREQQWLMWSPLTYMTADDIEVPQSPLNVNEIKLFLVTQRSSDNPKGSLELAQGLWGLEAGEPLHVKDRKTCNFPLLFKVQFALYVLSIDMGSYLKSCWVGRSYCPNKNMCQVDITPTALVPSHRRLHWGYLFHFALTNVSQAEH